MSAIQPIDDSQMQAALQELADLPPQISGFSPELRELARQYLETPDLRTLEEKIEDGVSFIMGTDYHKSAEGKPMSTEQNQASQAAVFNREGAVIIDTGLKAVDLGLPPGEGPIVFASQSWDDITTEKLGIAPVATEHPDTIALRALISRLHAEEKHPDYEYDSVEHQRKTCGDSYPPEGEGWEENLDKDDGCSRYDHTEDHHWRRLKSFKLTDEPKLHEVPELKVEKVTPAVFLASLEKVMAFNKGMRRLENRGLLNLSDAFESLAGNPESKKVADEAAIDAVRYASGFYHTEERYYLIVAAPTCRVLFDVVNKTMQYQLRRGNGSWGKRHSWDRDYCRLPLDLTVLAEIFTTPEVTDVG